MNKVIETYEVVDENGQVRSRSKTSIFKGQEPNYIKLYLQDISYLHDIPKSHTNVLYELLSYVTYGTNEISLSSGAKKRIVESSGMSMSSLNNNLSLLAKNGLIERIGTGMFRLNPFLFGKGDWKSIKELRDVSMHLEITYDKLTNKRIVKGTVR